MQLPVETADTFRDRLKEQFRFFKMLENEELAAFLQFCQVQTGSAGETLWQEGDTDNYAAFIVSGKLGIKKKTEFEKYMIVGTFSRGTVAGELCLLTNHARSVTAVILEELEVLKLTSEDFEKLIAHHPMIGLKLLKHIFMVISHRLSRSTERMAKIF